MRQGVLILASVFLLALMIPGTAGAETLVPFPSIPKANDNPDYHGDEEIRKTHMLGLMHQRDETMHEGVRSKDDSLNACMTCHAVKSETGMAVSYDSPQHFCRVCHDYTAVTVDCFSCHASTPDMRVGVAEATGGNDQ